MKSHLIICHQIIWTVSLRLKRGQQALRVANLSFSLENKFTPTWGGFLPQVLVAVIEILADALTEATENKFEPPASLRVVASTKIRE